MIDISFLRSAKVGGMEFMDFQYTSFFDDLSAAFDEHIVDNRLTEIPDAVYGIVRKYTGFANITFELIEYGNLAIEAGYINPNNVFNIEDIEKYFPHSESTLHRWFSNNKETFFKGSIDYNTGKVEGDYTTLPFRLFINGDLSSYIHAGFLKKHDVSFAQALAAACIHELGHAFGGLMMIHQAVYDSVTMRSAISFFSKAKLPKDRITIYKDALKLLDGDAKGDSRIEKQIGESGDPNEFVLVLTKIATQRNLRRSLSLGVPKMNSEVVADAYSVRMGCGRALAVSIGAIIVKSHKDQLIADLIVSLVAGLYGMMNTISLTFGLGFGGVVFLVIGALMYMANNTPDAYNSEYRRMSDILSEMIGKLKDNKFMSAQEKQKYLQQVIETQKLIDANKSFIEGSVFQSAWMWLKNGSDAKLTNIEHYTSLIANSKTNILSEQFNSLS